MSERPVPALKAPGRVSAPRQRRVQGRSTGSPKPSSNAPSPKPERLATKAGQVVQALRSRKGASIEDLMKLTGWQAHSVRGFLSGTVRKKHGLDLVKQTDKAGVARYSIASEPV
ncbi:hypothetical protein CSC94_22180 [Zhengella mangrovi]|uniref:DUF3489 domain-containing protein n=2 Tax=Zhengella mangrovi TaxID=1982044 RepID=A0A2G1QHB4_9HYPH|nr:hypothetical protein CSC94_22180 [Zhengella mangrovi]